MRVVIDTNVIVSGLYAPHSVPGRVLDAGNTGAIELCAPQAVRDELKRVLAQVLGFSPLEVDSALKALKVEWIPEAVYRDKLPEARELLRDPDDAPVLACALAVGGDIVSGDNDVHAVKTRRTRIWRPSELAGKSK